MSINEASYAYGAAKSSIREIAAYGAARKAQVGAENVYDFSLGNPSIPAPEAVRTSIERSLALPPTQLHGYTPAAGLPSAREAVAKSLNRRFGTSYGPGDLYLTCGAAASLSISFHALVDPGDEVIVIAPYFPEYRVWIETAGATCVEVMADEATFQIDTEAVGAAINARTKAVVINSPNNPVGSVYSAANLQALSDVLHARQEELGTSIYLIADEPYRELVYSGVEVPYLMNYYDNTLVCYSYSKSLSLPGERIGYIAVCPQMEDAGSIYLAVCGAGRSLGYVCAPSLFQHVIARCINARVDIDIYRENRDILYDNLTAYGYECVKPDGAFYLFVKALEEDAYRFFERAKAHEILVVPCDDFGIKGYVRIAYCCDKAKIEGSLPAFRALAEEYKNQ
jgi:aspartate aminotransferase